MNVVQEFMLVFALILFVFATYHTIQFIYGKSSTRMGVISIISLLGSVCYPVYYFSDMNEGHRKDFFDMIFPVAPVVNHIVNGIAEGVREGLEAPAAHAANAADAGIQRAIGGVGNAAFGYGGAALMGVVVNPIAPAIAAILAGPLGWFLIPLLGFLLGIGRNNRRVLGGGKRAKKTT